MDGAWLTDHLKFTFRWKRNHQIDLVYGYTSPSVGFDAPFKYFCSFSYKENKALYVHNQPHDTSSGTQLSDLIRAIWKS